MNQRELENNIFIKIAGGLLALTAAAVNLAGTILLLPLLVLLAIFQKKVVLDKVRARSNKTTMAEGISNEKLLQIQAEQDIIHAQNMKDIENM